MNVSNEEILSDCQADNLIVSREWGTERCVVTLGDGRRYGVRYWQGETDERLRRRQVDDVIHKLVRRQNERQL